MMLLVSVVALSACKLADNQIQGTLPTNKIILQFESDSDGSGQPYVPYSTTLRMGEKFDVYSVLRDSRSSYLGAVDVNWSVVGLDIFNSSNNWIEVGSMTPGAKRIQATSPEGFSFNFDFTVEPVQVLETSQTGMFGASAIATADQDLNGDGYKEIVVRNSAYDNNRGRLEVYSGATRQLMYALEGQDSDLTDMSGLGNRFGWYVRYIDDISGDGFKDMLVSPLYLNGYSSGQIIAIEGDTGATLYSIVQPAMWFGWWVEILPDINNDGFQDFLVSHGSYNMHTGKLWVYSGVDGSEIYTLQGASMLDMFASSVLIMDSDNNGESTLYVGALGVGDYGRIYSYNLKTGASLSSYTGTLTYPVKSLKEAPDVNGDGHKDIYSGMGGSATYNNKAIFSGANVQPIGSAFVEEVINTSFGMYYAEVDDLNNDAKKDLVIAATAFSSNTGKVYVYSAANQSLLYSITGEAAGNNFGMGIKSLGDVNGDGRGDFLVSAPNFDSNRGKLYVYSGIDGSLLYSMVGENTGDNFGLAFLQDFNGDGKLDIVANASSYDASRGKSYVYSGANGSLLYSLSGQAQGDQFMVLSSNHDFNTDGVKDLAASSRSFDSARGKAFIYSGSNGALIRQFQADETGEQLGSRILTTDLSGSGSPQIILSAPGANSSNGKFYFLF